MFKPRKATPSAPGPLDFGSSSQSQMNVQTMENQQIHGTSHYPHHSDGFSQAELPRDFNNKRGNLNEHVEIENLRLERDEALQRVDDIIADLIEKEQKLEEQEQSLQQKDQIIIRLNDRIDSILEEKTLERRELTDRFDQQEAHHSRRQIEIEDLQRQYLDLKLQNEKATRHAQVRIEESSKDEMLREKDHEILELQATLREQEREWDQRLRAAEARSQATIQTLDREVRDKREALKAREIEWFTKTEEAKAQYQAELQSRVVEREDAENKIRNLESQLRSHDAQGNEKSFEESNDLLQQLATEKGRSEQYLEELRQARAAPVAVVGPTEELLTELEEQKKMCAFFKKNSEKLSKEMKEVKASNRSLDEELRLLKRG